MRAGLEENFMHFMGGIHALEHAAIGMLPLLIMADRNDFGGISTPMHIQLGLPAVFIYDGLPGGAGLTRQAFSDARALLEATCKTVASCPCEDGCPSCVHSPKCGSGNRPISKLAALELLRRLLAPGSEGDHLLQTLVTSPPPPRPELEQKLDFFAANGAPRLLSPKPPALRNQPARMHMPLHRAMPVRIRVCFRLLRRIHPPQAALPRSGNASASITRLAQPLP